MPNSTQYLDPNEVVDLTDPDFSPRKLLTIFKEWPEKGCPKTVTKTMPKMTESVEINMPKTDIDISTHLYTVDLPKPEEFGIVTVNEKGKASLDKMGMVRYIKACRVVFEDRVPYIFDGAIYRKVSTDHIETMIYKAMESLPFSIFLTRSMVADMIAMLQVTDTWEYMDIPEAFNADDRYTGTLIPFQNGLYNMDTDTLLPFTPFVFAPYQYGAYYNPRIIDHPVERVYRKIIPDDETREFFFTMVGYVLFSDRLSPPGLFLIYGPGNTGKTALQEAVATAIGRENMSQLDLAQICGKFTTEGLKDMRLNICGETGAGQTKDRANVDGELLKKLSEGQTITVDRKHGKPFRMTNTAKLWFITNSLPNFGDTSSGLYRRLYIIPCRVEQRWEDQIYDKLTEEDAVSWLVNKALVAYLRFVAEGSAFKPSTLMKYELSNYKIQESLMDFLEDYLGSSTREDVPDLLDGQVVRDLYLEYKQYVQDTGGSPLSQRRFSEKIRNEYGMQTEKSRLTQLNGRPTNLVVFRKVQTVRQ